MTSSLDEALRIAMEVVLTRAEIADHSPEQGLVTLAGEVMRLQRDNDKLKQDEHVWVFVGLSIAAGLWGRDRTDLLRLIADHPKFAAVVADIVCQTLKQSSQHEIVEANSRNLAAVLDLICEKSQQ